MRIAPSQDKTTIVLVGHLNPKIFTPLWFAKNEVIGAQEAENAEVVVVHDEVIKFNIGWLTVVVERNRFIAEVTEPPHVRLYDFVLKTFGELMMHTPMWMMGINKHIIFDAGSVENRDKIGDAIAPKDVWGEWSEELMKSEKEKHSGMTSMLMRQTITGDDRPNGYIQTKVEPAKINNTSVLIEVNDHFELKNDGEIVGCQEIMTILSEKYDKSITHSEWIIDQVMSIAE